MKSAIYRAVASEAILAKARRREARVGATVLLYHDLGLDDEPEEAWQIVRGSDFRAQVAYLRRHYEVVDMDCAWAWLRGERDLPKPPVVLTFDDGLRGNYLHLLPLVRELSIPVLIYVSTEHIETQQSYWFDRLANALQGDRAIVLDLMAWNMGRFEVTHRPGALRWAQIQRVLSATKHVDPAWHCAVAQEVERQAGVDAENPVGPLRPMTLEMLQAVAQEPLITLGVHTHGHELLTQLSPEQIRATLQTCRDRLLQWTGRDAVHVAYPSGFHDERTRAEVASMGFATATTTRQAVWTSADDPMDIPRFAVGRYDSLAKFKVNIVGGLRQAVGF